MTKERCRSATSNRHRRRGGRLGTLPAISGREGARRAGQAIERQLLLLETAPNIGHPFPEFSELRELVIAFGDSGYVALYRHEPADDAVYVLAFRHQKEAGY
jgi:plasmid stabilization system protein ParE